LDQRTVCSSLVAMGGSLLLPSLYSQVVADDCAVPRTKGITGARGVAGTVLVHKIAGAAAHAGLGLEEVRDLARRACARMGTMGFALDSVTIPGADAKNDRLDEKTIEIGLGIHGEAGASFVRGERKDNQRQKRAFSLPLPPAFVSSQV
jgi:Dak1 domain